MTITKTPGKSFSSGASPKKYHPRKNDMGIEKYSNGVIWLGSTIL